MGSLDQVALFRHFPELRGKLPWACIGHWPTPVERLACLPGTTGTNAIADRGPPIYVKREDLSNPVYGGNKIRTLEPVLGRALDAGATTIWATGAYGSNHAVATASHARSLGLEPGAALFPQPPTVPARANLSALLALRPALMRLRNVIELPLALARLRRRPGAFVMTPGAASPVGALGSLSAALELAEQIAAGACPPPARIVLAAGSTCTTAGLLVGLHLAAHLGIAFTTAIPRVVAVRVTPWPVTSATYIVQLAYRTMTGLARLLGMPAPVGVRRLHAALQVEGGQLGKGYGQPTTAGYRAMYAFHQAGGPHLDEVYSAKSGAALLEIAGHLARLHSRETLLFWATKSSAPLPYGSPEDVARAPRPLQMWLAGPHHS